MKMCLPPCLLQEEQTYDCCALHVNSLGRISGNEFASNSRRASGIEELGTYHSPSFSRILSNEKPEASAFYAKSGSVYLASLAWQTYTQHAATLRHKNGTYVLAEPLAQTPVEDA